MVLASRRVLSDRRFAERPVGSRYGLGEQDFQHFAGSGDHGNLGHNHAFDGSAS